MPTGVIVGAVDENLRTAMERRLVHELSGEASDEWYLQY